jgi:TfoX/Sxy family transcriptional regulator of competence genes
VAYDEDLADALRELIHGEDGVTEKRMFGGLAFLIHGNLAVTASSRGGLLLRCDPAETEALVQRGADRFEMRGRAMDGWLHLRPGAWTTDEEFAEWVGRGVSYARSLPPKKR